MTSQETERQMEADLTDAMDGLTWTRHLLRIIGIWPSEINDWICLAAILSITLHCYTYVLAFLHHERNPDYFRVLPEIVFFSITLVKLAVHKLQSTVLKSSLNDIASDFSPANYRTARELLRFLRYNAISKIYIKVSIPVTTISACLYCVEPIVAGFTAQPTEGTNSSWLVDQLPLHAYYPFDVTESSTFIGLYLYQLSMVIIGIAGYIGTDCLFVTLTLHLCGQYAVLSYQIHRTLDDTMKFHKYFHSLMLRHQRLIRLTKAVDLSFRVLILYQVLLLTFLICFLWHGMISSTTDKQYMEAFPYFLSQGSMIVSLFGYCFIGECFIYESGQVAEALYFTRWYELPPNHTRDLQICLLRSQRPIEITAGQFFALSFSRFTEILKLSVGYLSFLHTFTG